VAALTRGVTWYPARIAAITTTIPERAHALAAQQAAGLAALAIRSKRSGRLARDLATAKVVGPMHRQVTSSLPYAAKEHSGGPIRVRNAKRMLIRGTRGATRSDVGGAIAASATEVQHPAKRWGDAAAFAFPRLFTAALRRLMP
jgi:hypothetical protein